MKYKDVNKQARNFALGIVVIIVGALGLVNLIKGGVKFVEIHFFGTAIEVHYETTNVKRVDGMLIGRSKNKKVQSYQESVIVGYISPETGKENKGVIDYYNVAQREVGSKSEAYWYSDNAPIITKKGMEQALVKGSLLLLLALFFSINMLSSKRKMKRR